MVESKTGVGESPDSSSDERSRDGCGSCGTGKALAANTESGNDLKKTSPTTGVRFGYMRYVGEFGHQPDVRFTCGAKVVIQTQRGIEIGEQVPLLCAGCDKATTRDQLEAWLESSGEDTYILSAGRILREATAADLAEYARIQDGGREKREFAQSVADGHGLSLKVVECECLFGGERIIFYFTAGERVDFRALVKDLAKEYRTRIEMRQIGARDEARLLADYETCGREVCCKLLLKTLRPISMRMAKLQKATLDPSQVSGRCGRLKCCLRYEHISYEELTKRLPRLGVRIRTNQGEGVVVNRQVLTQLVQIRGDNETLMTVAAEDITAVDVQARASPEESPAPVRPTKVLEEQPAGKEGRGKTGPAKPQPARRNHRRVGKRTDPEPPSSTSPEAPADDRAGGEATSRRRRRRRRRRPRRTDGGPNSSDGSGSPPTGR